MAGVDQVGAHSDLFFRGSHYKELVEHVGYLIQNWMNEVNEMGVEDPDRRLA